MKRIVSVVFAAGAAIVLSAAAAQAQVSVGAGGDVTFNFVNAEIREVVDAILGQSLKIGYIIDPRVQGTVTVRTTRPLTPTAAVAVLEEVLLHLEAAGMESRYLALADTPDPDLLIRTGGEQRLSNFLLWQSAYAEYEFIDTLWPDFNKETFKQTLDNYVGRSRRYGGVST